MFWKKKKPQRTIALGLELKRCTECPGSTRPCEVDGKPARFHRWADEDKGLLRINAFALPEEQAVLHRRFRDEGVIPSCCSMEALRVTFALVEYPDGTVGKVKPDAVRFLDREEV